MHHDIFPAVFADFNRMLSSTCAAKDCPWCRQTKPTILLPGQILIWDANTGIARPALPGEVTMQGRDWMRDEP
jgi:hypothetical protein